MRDLNKEEMMEINGGGVDKKKERSFFDRTIDGIGGAITGFAGMISSWFN